MKYVDTNALIRVVLNDLPELATQAETTIRQAETGELIILDTVVEEACTVLEFNSAYRLPRPVIHKILTRLFKNTAFRVSETAWQALDAYGKHPKLDFTDCLLLAVANGRKDMVMTFDKGLLKMLS